VNLFNGGGLWAAFLAINTAIEKSGALNLPLGGNVDPSVCLDLFRSLGVTALVGLPSTLLRLAHAAEVRGSAPEIRTVLYGGEQMSDAMRAMVARKLGARVIKSVGYSAIDAGHIGYQCGHAVGSVHHALERYCHVEICDPETLLPVAPGEEGEIVVTNLSREVFPVIRGRTGDRGRQVLEPCACGATGFTFELLGRCDDMIRIGGADVHVSDVERLCAKLADTLSLFFQLRISKDGVDDAYELCIETKQALPTPDLRDLTAQAEREYLAIAEEVSSYRQKGMLRHFKLTLLPPGGLRGNERTGKIRRVLDTR
jgi:phenylacetate-coenzyme A ligase PaaK-like adenylate-forming protein